MPLAELPKAYDPQDAQRRWYAYWLEKGYFHADPSSEKPPYTIVIPPPNVTGALHLGHALNNTIQDILDPLAADAGVRRALDARGPTTRGSPRRPSSSGGCWKRRRRRATTSAARRSSSGSGPGRMSTRSASSSQLRLMGCSCDWERTRFTLDPVCARAVRTTFFRLFQADKIFRGKRLVNWDTHLRTAVADDEIEYEDVKGQLWTIRYPVAGSETSRSTSPRPGPRRCSATRPSPSTRTTRYKHLIGKDGHAPADGSDDPDHRRRHPRRPQVRHRVRQGHPRARPERLCRRGSGTTSR